MVFFGALNGLLFVKMGFYVASNGLLFHQIYENGLFLGFEWATFIRKWSFSRPLMGYILIDFDGIPGLCRHKDYGCTTSGPYDTSYAIRHAPYPCRVFVIQMLWIYDRSGMCALAIVA